MQKPFTRAILALLLLSGTLTGCSRPAPPEAPPTRAAAPSQDATPALGYSAGPKPAAFYAATSSNPVVSRLSFDEIAQRVAIIQEHSGLVPGGTAPVLGYVFFDPLCPHCAKLTLNMLSPDGVTVLDNVAWVPVGFLQEFSTLQGAALLSSPEPAKTLFKHETLVAAGKGKEYALNVKIATPQNIDKVVANTRVWRDAGATQVPFIVTKDPAGKTLAVYGALEGFEMAEFLSKAAQVSR